MVLYVISKDPGYHVFILGFILWKWANGSDSADPNLDCIIGSKRFADGSSHYFTSIMKLGNHRSSERLRCFNSSKGTNLAILIILAGDIETNPGPRSQCTLCKKYCKVSDKVIECTDCGKRFHAKCSNLGADDLLKIETGNSDWFSQSARLITACAVVLFSMSIRQFSAMVARCGFTMNAHS